MLPTSKSVNALASAAATAGTTVTATIDRLGYDYASIDVLLAGASATTALTALKLSHSDDNTTFTDITGFVGGTSFTIPTTIRTVGDTSGPTVCRFDVDLRSRGRYIKVTAAPGGTTAVDLNARLFRGDEQPTTAAQVGAALLVTG